MELVLLWVAVAAAVGGIGWAVLNALVYQLARSARRGWEDEGRELDRQRGEALSEPGG